MSADAAHKDEQIAELQTELKAALTRITNFEELVHHLREENQALRDEVARLKGQKGKPKIRPSRLNHDEKPHRDGGARRQKDGENQVRQPDRTEVIKAVDVPPGSVFKGYADYTLHDLVIKAETILYRAEKWLTPDGKLITGKLPIEAAQGHFGPVLRSFILYQYYHALVTEPLILEELHEWGVAISSGQLHRLVTEGKEQFHREKDDILRVGLQVSRHIHVDDTGARHAGKNGYCTHIGNELFAWFESTNSKSRINFLQLLRAGRTDYVLGSAALDYMAAQNMPKHIWQKLADTGEQTLADESQWKTVLQRLDITDARHVRIATEGVLLGSVLSHGINPNLAIMSDDAGQFDVLIHALCWIHAERILAKLIGFNDAQRAALAAAQPAAAETLAPQEEKRSE